jgi:hypothetical protein
VTTVLLLAVVFLGLVVALPLLAGWQKLSVAYPPTAVLPVASPLAVTPYIGFPLIPVWAGVGANKEGIYLEPAFPASLLLRPAFLPWKDIVESDTRFGWSYAELRARQCPRTPVFLIRESYDGVCSRAGRSPA